MSTPKHIKNVSHIELKPNGDGFTFEVFFYKTRESKAQSVKIYFDGYWWIGAIARRLWELFRNHEKQQLASINSIKQSLERGS